MSSKRNMVEMEAEAVKQATERGLSVGEVAERLGVAVQSLYQWIKVHGLPETARVAQRGQADEVR